jgi:hypothetical protein
MANGKLTSPTQNFNKNSHLCTNLAVEENERSGVAQRGMERPVHGIISPAEPEFEDQILVQILQAPRGSRE